MTKKSTIEETSADNKNRTKNANNTNNIGAARHILVADDDAAIRLLLRTVLEEEGYTVTEATEGQGALDGLKAGTYDLVLLDMRLPGMTGIEVLKGLREKEGEVPAILMTAYGSPNIAIQASSLGAYSYITNPFDVDDVIANISR